jgi:hypothetical protein
MEKIKDADYRDPLLAIHEFMVHTFPFASVFFSVTFSNIKFSYSHVAVTVIMCFLFLNFNYYAVININNGDPFYPFFPWHTDFYGSVFNAAFLTVSSCMVYLASCVYANVVLPSLMQKKTRFSFTKLD